MDYNGGDRLLKYQWNVIHDPGHVWGIFEGDGESEDILVGNISEDFLNKDGKTVSFLTPDGSILSLPQANVYNVLFQYGTVVDVTNKGDRYIPELIVGALRGFVISKDKVNTEIYKYSNNKNEYVNTKTNEKYVQEVGVDAVDGFVYPQPCGEDYILYKFPVKEFPAFVSGSKKKITFTTFATEFSPFANSLPIRHNGIVIKQSIKNEISADCNYCLNEATMKMTQAYCEKPELIWVDKIAQMRALYPEYFGRFTQQGKIVAKEFIGGGKKDGNWEVPQTLTFEMSSEDGKLYDTLYANKWPWGEYLESHQDINAAYTTNKVAFFTAFYTEFDRYIRETVISNNNFWATFNESTPLSDLTEHLKNEAKFDLEQAPLDKREIAFKKVVENTSFWISREEDCLKLLLSFNKNQYTDVLEYIERNIGYQKLYDNFYDKDNWALGGNACLTAVLMRISQMVMESGHLIIDVDKERTLLDDVDAMPQLEADLFQFKNFNWSFANKNALKFKAYEQAPYNQMVSVHIAGSFKFGGKDYKKGLVIQIPAIQAVLMSHVNNLEVTGKTAWMFADLASLTVGVGGLKIFLTVGNYVRKIAVAADLVGSTAAAVAQSLNTDAISDKLRSRIQMSGFLLSLPNLAMSIGRVNKVVEDLDQMIDAGRTSNGALATEKELAELKEIRDGLRAQTGMAVDFADDIAEIERRVITLGEGDVNKVKGWLNNTADNNVYIAVHSNGSTFKVIHNGQDVEISHRSLAKWLDSKNIPANKQIVLLSCTDLETAQHLANKCNRTIIANDGWVDVYDNGVIRGERDFKRLSPKGKPANAPVENIGQGEIPGGSKVRLATNGAATAVSLVPELTAASRVHLHSGEVKITMKNGLGQTIFDKTFPADQVWEAIEDLVENHGFIKLLKENPTPKVEFTGLHNWETVSNNPTKLRINAATKKSVGNINGKDVWIAEPEVRLPDFEDMRKAGKWTGNEKWQVKKKGPQGRVSTFFAEGMDAAQIDQLISDAFRVKQMQGTREWIGIVPFNGKQVQIHGYLDNNVITSAFIEEIK
ncbi:hypothetical protein [Chitinophaga sp. HK235]|uniref:hypothetical protein n=1 Tax=Chitinophaga sp. HK235 TaxID=2952571 RepID=UPI001BA7A8D2|nr:hypothetical protein [Chitinophaga sp. HK235]